MYFISLLWLLTLLNRNCILDTNPFIFNKNKKDATRLQFISMNENKGITKCLKSTKFH